MENEVKLDFGRESRTRGRAFQVKRSRVKHLHSKFHQSLSSIDLRYEKRIKKIKSKKQVKSEKLKKRPNLIEDYFYPESTSVCLDPKEHAPVVQTKENSERQSQTPRLTRNDLEGTMALKEVADNQSCSFLNCAIVRTIKKIIKVDSADISSFENWDRNTETEYSDNVMNDIKRSRIRDSEDKEYILEDLL